VVHLSGGQKPLFKVAVLDSSTPIAQVELAVLKTRYVDFYPVTDLEQTEAKVAHNQIDCAGCT